MAIWDNIATQHHAINDYYPARRVMERIAIASVPLSRAGGRSAAALPTLADYPCLK